MIKTCEICGQEFEAKQRTQLVCSDEYRHKKRLAYLKKRSNFPDKFICELCGREITNAKRRTRKYCDDCASLLKAKRFKALCKKSRLEYVYDEKEKARYKRYYDSHREEILARHKIYNRESRPFERVKDRERYRRNPEPKKARSRQRYHLFKDVINPRRYILLKLKKEENGQLFLPFCHTCGKKIPTNSERKKYCSDACYHKSPWHRLWLRIKSEHGY